MRRYELLRSLLPVLAPGSPAPLVVCNLGYPARELYSLGDRPTFFYMLGSMGLASSIALGIAMNTDRAVVALDGDGSVLMNLGTLATIAHQAPPNYTLLIVDNGAYGSTGDQPSYTASGLTSLAAIARGAGIASVHDVAGADAAGRLRACVDSPGPHVLVAHVAPGSEPCPVIPLSAAALADRTRRLLAAPAPDQDAPA